jgi:hypothetical protein
MPNRDQNPQNGLQGSSYIYRLGTSPNTRAVTSQKVRLLAPAYGASSAELFQVGVLATFNPSETRNIDQVRGIGYGDIISELVPGNTEAMTASVERTLLYLSNLWQSTGYAAGVDGPVRSLRHHRWPFDIEQQIVFSRIADADLNSAAPGTFAGSGFTGGVASVAYPPATGGGGNPSGAGAHTVLITMYETCWWNDFNFSLSRDQGMISENGSCTITDVHDFSSIYGEFLATGNDPTIGQLGSIRYGNQLNRGNGFGA